MKNILVTGGTGYIGSCLIKRLVVNKQYKIYNLVRASSDLSILSPYLNKIDTVIYKDFKSLVTFFGKNQIDLVVHLAAYTGSENNYYDVEKSINSNLLLSAHLLEAMRFGSTKKIINTGTYWQYGGEDSNTPNSLYSLLKYTTVEMVRFYQKTYDFCGLNLILYDVYGKNDFRKKIIYKLLKLPKKYHLNMTPGLQKLSFVYIEDVINGYVNGIDGIFKGKYCGETYHLFNSEVISLRELVVYIENISNKKLNINWGKLPYPLTQIMQPDLKKKKLPNWNLDTKIKQGLEEVYRKITSN